MNEWNHLSPFSVCSWGISSKPTTRTQSWAISCWMTFSRKKCKKARYNRICSLEGQALCFSKPNIWLEIKSVSQQIGLRWNSCISEPAQSMKNKRCMPWGMNVYHWSLEPETPLKRWSGWKFILLSTVTPLKRWGITAVKWGLYRGVFLSNHDMLSLLDCTKEKERCQ